MNREPTDRSDDSLLLSIDSGTQSVRALVFDLRGNLVAISKVALDPLSAPEPGWAEQDVEVTWQRTCDACEAREAREGP